MPLLTFCTNSIEPVKIVFPDGTTKITPDISSCPMIANPSSLPPSEICDLLRRMSLEVEVVPHKKDEILVNVPCTRPDIFHQCDIMEDVAIAYG